MAKKGRRAVEEERLLAVQLLRKGKSADEVADMLDVGRSTVLAWQAKYRRDGLAGLSTKFASGRPTVLTDDQILRLRSMIVGKNPRQYQLDFALWTRKLVAELISREFKHRLSLVTVGRILKKLGLSAQKPLYRAYQRDPDKVRIWKEETFPQIRKAAKEAGATIFFEDESGIRTDHHAGTTWGAIGETPVVEATGERKSVNMISAISGRGELHFDLFQGSMTAAGFIEFCERLLDDCPTPVFLIVDGSSTHTAKVVKEYVARTAGRLSLFFLPPYSPDLNPDEWVWNYVKNTQIKRAVAMSQCHLWTLARDALRKLQGLPEIICGFFRDPHLAYITASGDP